MLRYLAVAGLAMTALGASAAQAQSTDPTLYTATYVELVPTAAKQGATLLKAYRDAGRKDAGNTRLEVVQRLHWPSQFVVLGVWKDKAAFDAHMAAVHSKQLGEKLPPLFASPNDERQHNVLTVADTKTAGGGAIFVVTHVDVPPPRKDELLPLLNQLAAESRKEAGNVRFDIWQQGNRPNHFTVVEAWTGQKAYDSHITAAHTKQFRTKLTPMTGALYDERLYKLVN
jgi:quinol monooxygenase YgiN